jgi:hypothetical protein
MIHHRENLRTLYAREIDELAHILANGWDLESIQQQHPQDVAVFQYLWSTLNAGGLIPDVEKQRDKILHERSRQKESQPCVQPPNLPKEQNDFFYLVPDTPFQYSILDPDAPKANPLDRTIDRWHIIFQKRGLPSEYARNKILASEASHEWRAFLKSIGYSQHQKTERLRRKTAEAID